MSDPRSKRPHREERRLRAAARAQRAEKVALEAQAAGPTSPPTLRLPDTGITLEPRATRGRGADPWLWPLVATIAGVLLAATALTFLSDRPTARRAVEQAKSGASAVPTAAIANMESPTPAFARYKNVLIHLPVTPEEVTTAAFHQASYRDVLPMVSLIREESFNQAIAASKRRIAAARAASATPSAPATGQPSTAVTGSAPSTSSSATDSPPVRWITESGLWTGSAIRMWRTGRPGSPDSAVDIGAKPGTVVYSPVSGQVLMVERYKLYNKYPDVKIHIRPEGISDIDVIVMHVKDPLVEAGAFVVGGVTKIAAVRRLSSYAPLQLASYSLDRGDHVHVQLNLMTARLGLGPLLGSEETTFVQEAPSSGR